ncbi:hypothetical protein K466DRAFT_581779 [Polyporus arcularius HHB13444]|uniref:Uncharacterized protein n=1 Tax=Polyporus arcularius HHB13444 TaxID=1314778 RepID=A0A5C3PRY7_9APHY|nr:hypothetical protein K466DRAFT_581779 [Polyporus arcularius HHB13444]
MIPDEGQFAGRENERFYYESYAFAYEELLKAMFPNDLGFNVDRQIMPTGAGVFHCTIQDIPVLFGEIKPGCHANRTQDRYDADCEVRERLLDLVGYLRRNFEQKTRPDRVYAVSALGLQVRFYYADVGGGVGDPITVQPPPGPPYSQAILSGKDQYDYWRLSILDTLSVNTLKTICENVHKFAERVRSATVPHSDEAAAVEVFHGKYLMVRDFERMGLPVPEVGGCYGRVDLYTLIEDMETYRDAPPATKTTKRDKEYDDDLSNDPEATKVWRWRHKLQKVFLNSKAVPKEEEMPAMDELFSTLENYPNMTMQYLLFSKIGKVMRHISVLPYEKVPRDDEFKFQERAKVLLDKWYDIFVKTNGASDSAKPATDDTRKAADVEDPAVIGAETKENGTKAESDVKPDVIIKDESAAPANGAADESVLADATTSEAA